MEWSKEPPKEPGIYWWRVDRLSKAHVIRLDALDAVTLVGRMTGQLWSYWPEALGGEWAGPIQPPE